MSELGFDERVWAELGPAIDRAIARQPAHVADQLRAAAGTLRFRFEDPWLVVVVDGRRLLQAKLSEAARTALLSRPAEGSA